MIFYFQIAAAVILAVVAIFAGIGFIKKRKSKGLGQLIMPPIKVPLTIHLADDTKASWINQKEAKKLINDLRKQSFSVGSTYKIPERDNIQLLSMFFSDFFAIVYNDKEHGNWMEIGYQSENRSLYLATNAPVGLDVKTHPKNKRITKVGATAKELLNTLKQEVENVWAAKITNENFAKSFEKHLRRDIIWRNNEGGITIQEFKKILTDANSEFKITKEDLRRVFLETKVDELFQWHDACLDEYKRKSDQPDDEIKKFEDKLFIVPKKTISQAFIEYLVNVDFVQESVTEKLNNAFRKKSNIPIIFDLINNNYPDKQKAKKVWDLDFPLEAHIYLRGERN